MSLSWQLFRKEEYSFCIYAPKLRPCLPVLRFKHDIIVKSCFIAFSFNGLLIILNFFAAPVYENEQTAIESYDGGEFIKLFCYGTS